MAASVERDISPSLALLQDMEHPVSIHQAIHLGRIWSTFVRLHNWTHLFSTLHKNFHRYRCLLIRYHSHRNLLHRSSARESKFTLLLVLLFPRHRRPRRFRPLHQLHSSSPLLLEISRLFRRSHHSQDLFRASIQSTVLMRLILRVSIHSSLLQAPSLRANITMILLSSLLMKRLALFSRH
jgi:hypothetical protein